MITPAAAPGLRLRPIIDQLCALEWLWCAQQMLQAGTLDRGCLHDVLAPLSRGLRQIADVLGELLEQLTAGWRFQWIGGSHGAQARCQPSQVLVVLRTLPNVPQW